jgi:hypothetical protein
MQWRMVFQTFSSAEAQLVRSRLEAAEFTVNVAHELASLSMDGYAMAAGGIEVQVPEDAAEEALALIHAAPDDSAAHEGA